MKATGNLSVVSNKYEIKNFKGKKKARRACLREKTHIDEGKMGQEHLADQLLECDTKSLPVVV